MLEVVIAGGWVMVPILLCSVVAAAITLERLWTLKPGRVVPRDLSRQVWDWVSTNQLNHQRIQELRVGSPLGQILAAGLANRQQERSVLKEIVEDTGRHVIHELERYLNTLGTIAAVSPLLGLLGTVTGMIRTFSALTSGGASDPAALAGGISEALITTAAGLMVAIPALMAHRYLRGRVDALVVQMEKEAIGLVEALQRKQLMDSIAQGTGQFAVAGGARQVRGESRSEGRGG
jgi:biopolymer transport protein ExbB